VILVSPKWNEDSIARSLLGYVAWGMSCSASRLDGNENGNKKDGGPALPLFFILKRNELLMKAATIDCAT
jgi:hypothetical protein